jgi:zinc transport system substrate-binding protein
VNAQFFNAHRIALVGLLALLLPILSPMPAEASKSASPPTVVATLKPIHSLLSAIMEGVAEPKLLIETGASPHGYLLRPSEMRLIQRSDLLIWVGPQLETFLIRPIHTLSKRTSLLTLADAVQSELLPVRSDENWAPHTHHGHGNHGHDHEHDPHHERYTSESAHYDPHLWLSPRVATALAQEMANRLIVLDPTHAPQYRANLTQLQAKLEALFKEIETQLAPQRTLPYLVFHDAYQYFERDFGLMPIGSVQIDPERSPSARKIRALRQKIGNQSVKALFSEPQFEPRLVQTLIEGSEVCTGELDPLGARLSPGKELYFDLLRQLADEIESTLKRCSMPPNQAMMNGRVTPI